MLEERVSRSSPGNHCPGEVISRQLTLGRPPQLLFNRIPELSLSLSISKMDTKVEFPSLFLRASKVLGYRIHFGNSGKIASSIDLSASDCVRTASVAEAT